MTSIGRQLRETIINRAGGHCEYCGLAQVGQEATFHIDHVQPKSKGGPTTVDNLALACVSCSLRKANRIEGIDPETKERVRLFSPRRDHWSTHFSWEGARMIGRTTTGRATIEALALNRPLILAIREEESHYHRHPPPTGGPQ